MMTTQTERLIDTCPGISESASVVDGKREVATTKGVIETGWEKGKRVLMEQLSMLHFL